MSRLYTFQRQSFKAIGAVLLFASFLSCANEDLIDEHEEGNNDGANSWIWTPMIKIQKGDRQATLHLIDPRPFSNYMPPGPANPDYYKIWVSDTGQDNFMDFGQVDVSTTSLQFDQLANGKPYYFFVTSHRENFHPVHSDTVMTIPSEPASSQPFFNNISFSIKRVSASFDLTYFTYIHNDVLFVRFASGTSVSVTNRPYGRSSWSPTANKFVYVTSIDEGIYHHPHQVKLFEADTKQVSTLFQVDYNNYNFLPPTFMADGKNLSFLSSEGNSEKHHYDFWIFNSASNSKARISDFEQIGFLAYGNYDWSESGETIYLDGKYDRPDYHTDIYQFDVSTKVLAPVIESPWHDTSPSLSPDNHRIAFISDRTGKDELWVYDMLTSTYRQITGDEPHFDSRYTNLQWLSNEHMLITVFDGEKSGAAVIIVD